MPEQYCCKCCKSMDIRPEELLFPEFYFTGDDLYFVKVWGLERHSLEDLQKHAELLANGKVKLHLQCQQLTPDGLCGIYEERPQLCRRYQCESRNVLPPTERCEPERRYVPLQVIHG